MTLIAVAIFCVLLLVLGFLLPRLSHGPERGGSRVAGAPTKVTCKAPAGWATGSASRFAPARRRSTRAGALAAGSSPDVPPRYAGSGKPQQQPSGNAPLPRRTRVAAVPCRYGWEAATKAVLGSASRRVPASQYPARDSTRTATRATAFEAIVFVLLHAPGAGMFQTIRAAIRRGAGR